MPVVGEEPGNGFEDGLALVTTARGDVTFTTSSGKARQAELHAVETLTGIEVTSGKEGYAFFSLSNGSALGIHNNSQVRFESYQQRPFPPEKESFEYEASHSKLIVHLVEGSLSFSAERLSPLSAIIIKLPIGQIETYKASGRVVYDERGALITITSGIVSYDYPGIEEEEFINGPNQVRISKQSAALGRIAESSPESAPSRELTERLVQATHRANQRAIFKVPSDEAAIPRPVLVAKPEALQKPTPRPYNYLD